MDLNTIAQQVRKHVMQGLIEEVLGEETANTAKARQDDLVENFGGSHAYKSLRDDTSILDEAIEYSILCRRDLPVNLVEEIAAADREVYQILAQALHSCVSDAISVGLREGTVAPDIQYGEAHKQMKSSLMAGLDAMDISTMIEYLQRDQLAIAGAENEHEGIASEHARV